MRAGEGGMIQELAAICESLGSAAETGAARARRAQDVVLRGRWLAIAAARLEHRERVAARILSLGGTPPPRGSRSRNTAADLPTLLRADLATSHALSARCRRLARLAVVLGDTASAALCERLAAECLGHAAELARSLALLYAREVRTAAQ
jgi:bacterioferritin (cytochrome b1)